MKTNKLILFFILAYVTTIISSDIPTLSISPNDDNKIYTTQDSSTPIPVVNATISNTPDQTETKTSQQNETTKTVSSLQINKMTPSQNITSLKAQIKQKEEDIAHLQKSKKLHDPNVIDKIAHDQKMIQKYQDQIAANEKQLGKEKSISSTNSNKSLSLGKLSSKKRKSYKKQQNDILS